MAGGGDRLPFKGAWLPFWCGGGGGAWCPHFPSSGPPKGSFDEPESGREVFAGLVGASGWCGDGKGF